MSSTGVESNASIASTVRTPSTTESTLHTVNAIRFGRTPTLENLPIAHRSLLPGIGYSTIQIPHSLILCTTFAATEAVKSSPILDIACLPITTVS